MSPGSRLRELLEVVSTVAVTAAAIAVVALAVVRLRSGQNGEAPAARRRPELAVPTALQPLRNGSIEGKPSARAVLVEYTDFQCPFCQRFAKETLPTLRRDYVDTGKALVVVKQMPLPMHAFAERAAHAANCAGQQEKFSAMHDFLFALPNPRNMNEDDLQAGAKAIRLNDSRFTGCLKGSPTAISEQVAEAKGLGITGTPAFFVGTLESDMQVRVRKTLTGALPLGEFKTALDEVLRSLGSS
jgi:protein-disulfide isomerase